MQPTQGANLISNVPHNIVDSARTITAVVRHARRRVRPVERSRRRDGLGRAAADRAGQHDRRTGLHARLLQQRGPGSGQFLGYGYPYGPSAYFTYIDKWRASGTFDGLEFR